MWSQIERSKRHNRRYNFRDKGMSGKSKFMFMQFVPCNIKNNTLRTHAHNYACTFTAYAYANPNFHNYKASIKYNTIKKLFIYKPTFLTKL
jgi:hypothetical protein